ncbi:MAG: hypothetical protein NZ853_09895 [Leptospiraceae bacterium]|nr:hypothetical protein [Leptospiraceae bacterium]MDW7977007.1 hypothetical protein [Leptospiraceae bacterium]
MLYTKPFIANQKNYYVSKRLLDWLSKQPFHFLKNYISGQSLKYLRSQQPVLVFSIPENQYNQTLSLFQNLSLKQNLRLHQYKNAFKVILWIFEEEPKVEYHFLIQKPFIYPHVLISIDRLRYNPYKEAWLGNPQDERDLLFGKIRLIKPHELNMMHILTLVVYTSMLDFIIEKETFELLKSQISEEEFRKLNTEFLRNQFLKILTSARPSVAFLSMDELGILDWFLPELAQIKGFKKYQNYKNDLFFHCIYSCDYISNPDPVFRLAGLLMNIGKSESTKIQKEKKNVYLNEDSISAAIASQILKRFQFPVDISNKVHFLIKNHQYYTNINLSEKSLRKFIKKIDEEKMNMILQFFQSNKKAYANHIPYSLPIRKLLAVYEKEKELKIKDLEFKGEDIKLMGISPGPIYGITLKYLLEKVKKGELENKKEVLRKEAISYLEKEGFLIKQE